MFDSLGSAIDRRPAASAPLAAGTSTRWGPAGDRCGGRPLPSLAAEPRGGYSGAGVRKADSENGWLAGVEEQLGSAAGLVRAATDRIGTGQPDGTSEDITVAVEQLDRCLAALKGLEGATAAAKAQLIGCARTIRAHQGTGMAGTDHYLRDRLGMSASEAKKQSELSRRLEGMDATRDALADGRLGTEQAVLLSRAASNGALGGPEQVEDTLLTVAIEASPEQLRESIRRAHHAADADALRQAENRVHAARRASITHKPDGSWELYARLGSIAGEKLATCIRTYLTNDGPELDVHQRRSYQQRAADALETIADSALAATSISQGGVRPHVSVIVPWELLDHHSRTHLRADATPLAPDGEPSSTGQAGPAAITGHGITLSPEAATRLLCDARITRIVLGADSQPLNVGRATRSWTAGQRAAVAARDRGCRGPSCDRPVAWCDIHHVDWWSNGGSSDIDNTLMLCAHHHRLVHEGRWQLEVDPATAIATFTDANGNTIQTHPPPPP